MLAYGLLGSESIAVACYGISFWDASDHCQIIVVLHQDVLRMQKIVDGMQQSVVVMQGIRLGSDTATERLPDAYEGLPEAEDRCWDA